MPSWLADPFCCLNKSGPNGPPSSHLIGCQVLTERNEALSGKTTQVHISDTRRGERRYSWGHVAAVRDKDGIRLEVGAEGTNNTSSSPALLPAQALAAGDCLRAAAGNAHKSMCAGKSIYEIMWDELMTIVERLMTGQEAEDGRDPGRAEGVAYAIAVFTNPYAPNLEAIRDQAMERWEKEEEG